MPLQPIWVRSSNLDTFESQVAEKLKAEYYSIMTRYPKMSWIKRITFVCLYSLLIPLLSGQANKAMVFTSDIDNFWQAYDSVKTTDNAASQIEFMQTLYIQKGTAGLKAFMKLRNFDAARLVTTINKYPKFWESIRPNTLWVKNQENQINSYLQKFQKLYPDYKEANIYFTITAIRSGGTTKDSLVLVGAEIATGNAATDVSGFPDKRLANFFQNQKKDNIVPFTIHEYVHTQQKSEGKILLGQALAEVACD